VHVHYEELVSDPAKTLREVCAFLGIAFTPAMIAYGEVEGPARRTPTGLGDPYDVDRLKRPSTQSVSAWPAALAGNPARLAQAREIAARLTDDDLATWGFAGPALRRSLAEIAPRRAGPGRLRLSRYAVERRLLVGLRRAVHATPLGGLVRRVRTLCDVLLR
jgi:hypothetical protein